MMVSFRAASVLLLFPCCWVHAIDDDQRSLRVFTRRPTLAPTDLPTVSPTNPPPVFTRRPSASPTDPPTVSPRPTVSTSPTVTTAPSTNPTNLPSQDPSMPPTAPPTQLPTPPPSPNPTLRPTPNPTLQPTPNPTQAPVEPSPIPAGTFRLKLYWQDDYFWQEDSSERKWCASYDYGRSFCWYGDRSRSCKDDEMYIDDCDAGYEQSFEFIDAGNFETLIKVANDNKCWSRENRRIYLEDCDGNDGAQRWIAQNGDFSSYRFEITQQGFMNQCVTQDHHPKEREVVEMHDCEGARDGKTSYWNMY